MAEPRFMLVQLPRRASLPSEKIRPVLDKALDWIEVSPNTWLLWTSSSAERWYKRLERKFGPNTRFFIAAIDPENRHGRMPESFWEFLDKPR
ncbi:hypothetical protein BA190_24050 [Labrys sp. WJW]|uniref:hypothetical protein n=1 Tax=Labrys sp. WJW TaxID=1737983 RepID=UPI00082D7391|nr:hypothetical protein [Labrys sp. WJW]OCC02400.1 hypothetical protein BA190_24050 [Labrys sp. WJW]